MVSTSLTIRLEGQSSKSRLLSVGEWRNALQTTRDLQELRKSMPRHLMGTTRMAQLQHLKHRTVVLMKLHFDLLPDELLEKRL